MRTTIDKELLSSRSFVEIRTLYQELAQHGVAPYDLKSGDAELGKLTNLARLIEHIDPLGRKGLQIQRYKGLGEMNPEQLWETTMNPDTRTLLQVRIEDDGEADRWFNDLMGDDVERRREFIAKNPHLARNVDV